MIKKLLSTLFLSVCALVATAQEVEFTADRPGASTGPSTVGHKVVQLEQGVQYDGDGASGTFTFSNTLLRYGLFDGMEVRLGADALIYNGGESWRAAFAGLNVGTKIACFEGRGAIPAVSVLANLAIPKTGNSGFVVEHLAPSLYLLFDNPVNDWLSIGYNVGAEWDGATAHSTTFLALCLGFSITDRLGCFAESHNYFSQLGNGYCADFGFNYMVGERVQLDLAADLNLCNPKNCWAVSFGVAWQINNPKK
jgi:hypothetical protein